MIFVDTGAWFARFVPDDPDHARVMTWFAANGELLITSDYCVDETLTLLVARRRPKLALEAGRELFDETLATPLSNQRSNPSRMDSIPASWRCRLELHRLHEQNLDRRSEIEHSSRA